MLLRNLYLSCDPTHRIYASGKESYFPAYPIGAKITALLIGEVEASKNPDYPKGVLAIGWGNWETYSVIPAGFLVLKIEPTTTVPLETYMAVVNTIIGLTAWAGVHRILQIKSGDTLCVSGAAGAVGSLVCQLATKAGAKVVGIAGSKDKCDFVKSLGCVGAVNYKTDDIKAKLKELCPDGFTTYFDNVGGDITEQVLESMALEGRVAVCGMISQYDQKMGQDAGRLRCWDTILFRRLTVRGYICVDFAADTPTAFAELEGLLREGALHFNKHVFAGDLFKCVEAVQNLTRGTNTGKTMVKLAEPSNPAYKCV